MYCLPIQIDNSYCINIINKFLKSYISSVAFTEKRGGLLETKKEN